MSWLDAEDQEWYTKMADAFLKAHGEEVDAQRAKLEAEDKLITAMVGGELDSIHRKGSTIHLEVPDEGDVYLSVSFRSTLDLGA